MLTCLNPPFALQTEEAAPGNANGCIPSTVSPCRGTGDACSVHRQGPVCQAGCPGCSGCDGTHRYSKENLVSSWLLCSHLNSRGQLPSAMHVRTRRFPSRWTWLRTGSVLKYGETSSAERGGRGVTDTGEDPQPAGPITCQPHALHHNHNPAAHGHMGREMLVASSPSLCPSQASPLATSPP